MCFSSRHFPMHISVSPAGFSWNLNFPLRGEGGASAEQGLGLSQDEGGGQQLFLGDQMLRLGPAVLLFGRHLGLFREEGGLGCACAMLLAGSPIFMCLSVGSTEGSCIPGENEVGSLPKWEKWDFKGQTINQGRVRG